MTTSTKEISIDEDDQHLWKRSPNDWSPHFVTDVEANKPASDKKAKQTPQSTHCCTSFSIKKLFDTRTKRLSWYFLGFSIILTSVVLIAVSFKKVSSTEYGLEYNVHKKMLAEYAQSGGLHSGTPGFRFVKFPSTFVTVDLPDSICVSRDGLQVQISITFQYQLPKAWVRETTFKYRDFDKWATMVEAAGTSAIHHACGEFNIC